MLKKSVKHVFYDCPRETKRIKEIKTKQIITPQSAVEEINAKLKKRAEQRRKEDNADTATLYESDD